MPGTSISQIEVTNVDSQGIWLFVEGREYFLPYGEFPCVADHEETYLFGL